ncbi:hypothetical protein GW17_00026696 [Ensete ventricosum]|nr:hypothetical protein GW17_00026696 [Ensete ventricosum]
MRDVLRAVDRLDAVASVRGRGCYCTRWPLDATPAARDCLLMRLQSAACGRPVFNRRLMQLPPTRDRLGRQQRH